MPVQARLASCPTAERLKAVQRVNSIYHHFNPPAPFQSCRVWEWMQNKPIWRIQGLTLMEGVLHPYLGSISRKQMSADLITSDKNNPLGCERREAWNSIHDVRKITSARMLMRLEAVLFESPASRKSTPVPEKGGGGESTIATEPSRRRTRVTT